MKLYELSYLLPLELTEDTVRAMQEKINSIIVENQGILEKVEDIIKKRLGEPIKNQSAAYLATLNFHLEPEKLGDLDKKLKAENQILHYMIVNKKLRKAEAPRRMRYVTPVGPEGESKTVGKPKKVEIKEIEKKLEEILGE